MSFIFYIPAFELSFAFYFLMTRNLIIIRNEILGDMGVAAPHQYEIVRTLSGNAVAARILVDISNGLAY